ncbi:MAG: tetratricopeptide repeat protein [Polyangiaceae bacterium]
MNMTHTSRVAVLGLVALAACSSSDGVGTSNASGSASASAHSATIATYGSAPASSGAGPVGSHRTESPPLAFQNLEAQITGAEELLTKQQSDITAMSSLAGLLSARFQITAKSSDLDRQIALGESAVSGTTRDPKAFLLRARARAAAHRFSEALDDLAIAERDLPDGGKEPARASRRNVLVSLGRYDDVIAELEKIAKDRPSIFTLGDYAYALARMNRIEDAEKAFNQAELQFRAISPFSLVQLYFDRAYMWERAGNLELATSIYKAAHEKLPYHVHVATHLAPLIPPSEGIAMLRALVDVTDSPDVFATLGVLENLVTPHSGDADLAKAGELYLARYQALPTAYADHAGWFWVGPGKDPARAVEAAKANLANRPTAEAYELMLAAAEAASDTQLLCTTARDARSLKYGSTRLAQRLTLIDSQKTCEKVALPPPASSSAPR